MCWQNIASHVVTTRGTQRLRPALVSVNRRPNDRWRSLQKRPPAPSTLQSSPSALRLVGRLRFVNRYGFFLSILIVLMRSVVSKCGLLPLWKHLKGKFPLWIFVGHTGAAKTSCYHDSDIYILPGILVKYVSQTQDTNVGVQLSRVPKQVTDWRVRIASFRGLCVPKVHTTTRRLALRKLSLLSGTISWYTHVIHTHRRRKIWYWHAGPWWIYYTLWQDIQLQGLRFLGY